ncbi:hypothetical protein [Niveibacterium sp. SC-1]|uniref:hypothetical protein n=1 Tax=Niveibacterium sp. SC-1 TaxID=3135646 RepID=UPI00311FE5A7
MNIIDEALADVERAFRHLEFAIKLMCYCEVGHLELEKFDADTTILLPNENISFPTGAFDSIEAVVLASQALVGMAFGTSAIVLEAAYEVAGRPRKPTSRQPEEELRTLIYMVRCAFAHNPALPLWEARGPNFARTVSVVLQGSTIAVDLKSLHGKPFEYDHIGGFANWMKIKAESVALLQ